MTICYFSATGNSLYVARRIGGELLSIPQLMRQDEIRIEDDAIGVVCPCYNVEMPMMVRDFMRKAHLRCLEPPNGAFGGFKRVVWRLQTWCLECLGEGRFQRPYTTFSLVERSTYRP